MTQPLSAAIVGAGPAGLFTLDALLRRVPDARIDVFERLPTPFGLIRSGVAPDHQGTKGVVRQFARAFARPNVRLLGNVEVGRDIGFPALSAAYHHVFLATGAPLDRRLEIPGETLMGVYGAGAFMGWLNGHPDHRGLAPQLGPRVVIIGAGNVALDVARILAKTQSELASSDLCEHARTVARRVRCITVAGRGALSQARFAAAELRAFESLARGCTTIDPQDLGPAPDGAEAAELWAILARRPQAAPDAATQVRFRFQLRPVAFRGVERLAAIEFLGPDGGRILEPADAVITAIGSRRSVDQPPAGCIPVGWAAGDGGAIPQTRSQAAAAVERTLATTPQAPTGLADLERQLSRLAGPTVDWRGWSRIDASEVRRAQGSRPREKWTDRGQLLAAASCETN